MYLFDTNVLHVLQLMYPSQAMLNCRTKVDHMKNFQDLQRLHKLYHIQPESLIKEQKERKALNDYKNEKQKERKALDDYKNEKQKERESLYLFAYNVSSFPVW